MKLYITNYDNENITTIEVSDEFEILITEIDDEGVEGSDYEIKAAELREIVESKVANPLEIYLDKVSAEHCFDPLLCF